MQSLVGRAIVGTLASAALVIVAACTTTTTTSPAGSSGSSGSSGTSSSSGKTEGPESCEAPCEACEPYPCRCADGVTVRGCACSDSSCGDDRLCASGRACQDHGGNAEGSSGSSGTSGTSGSSGGQCIALGGGGCKPSKVPSECCTDSAHPDVACSGNNDGAGNAQCCVNAGKRCTKASDCCGNLTNPTLYTCKNGVCGTP